MKEQTLSNKIFNIKKEILGYKFTYFNLLKVEDVKESIKKLKEELKTDLTGCFTSQKQCDEWNKDTNRIIDNIFGDKLTKEQEQ
jgi:hypothetical protein